MPKTQQSHYRWLIVFAVIGLLLSNCTQEEFHSSEPSQLPTVPMDSCRIDPGIKLGSINHLVYGVNHGPWAIITDKTLPLVQNAGITMIRFPGGNWGDENDLQPYHIDQFVHLANQMESNVSINVRLHGGSPEKAAALVRYANVENNYAIQYWGIGNEPSLFATSRGVPEYGVQQFNKEWREIALAMKAVDDTILLIGPELHQFGSDVGSTPKDPYDLDWMTEFLKTNGDLVDIVSIHRYPFPQGRGGRAATVEELTNASAEWDQIIPYLRSLIIETTGRELPIAVTEVNSHWSNAIGGEATPDSFINALWWADALGRMIVNDVDIVNYFSLQSQPNIGGYGLLARSQPRPAYYVYQIYREFGDTLVFSGCNIPGVSIYTATESDGSMATILINLGAEDVTTPLIIDDESYSLVSMYQFDDTNLLHELSIYGDELEKPLQMKAHSIKLLKFE